MLAFADHGKAQEVMPPDGGDAETLLVEFVRAGIDHAAFAIELQREGAMSFAKSWNDLMDCIASKSAALTQNHPGGK